MSSPIIPLTWWFFTLIFRFIKHEQLNKVLQSENYRWLLRIFLYFHPIKNRSIPIHTVLVLQIFHYQSTNEKITCFPSVHVNVDLWLTLSLYNVA